MDINADFDKRALVHAPQLDWVASPMPGVARRMLDRVGDEVARATSIVRYDAGSHFSPHIHSGGEEFIVLEGVFQDEHGDYPPGSYVRNPPTSRHKPGSEPGCVIFVKLWQFDLEDRTQVKVDMNKMGSVMDAIRPGLQIMPLFQNVEETVQMETWAPGTEVALDIPNGAELLVLEGDLSEGGDVLKPQSWLRLPRASTLEAAAGPNGAKIWVKYGHLAHIRIPKPATI